MTFSLVLEATYIRDTQVVYTSQLEDRSKEVRECTLSDYRAALAPQKGDSAEERRRRASLLAEWERIFEVRAEFPGFEDTIEAAVFSDHPWFKSQCISTNGPSLKVEIERDEDDDDRCTVRFYRESSDAAATVGPDKLTRVSVPIFLERRILKSSAADFLEREFPSYCRKARARAKRKILSSQKF